MEIVNVEIFNNRIEYVGSAQTSGTLTYKRDYLDPEKNRIDLAQVECSVGDYILIRLPQKPVVGKVSDVSYSAEKTTLQYKDLAEILDVSMYMSMEFTNVEDYIKALIDELYVTTEDAEQKIEGLSVVAQTHTQGSLSLLQGINNLFDLCIEAFNVYQIVVEFSLNPNTKTILCTVKKFDPAEMWIEADRSSILSKSVTIKSYKATTNKAIVYDDRWNGTKAIYYMDAEGNITQNPQTRLTPVVQKTVSVTVKEDGEGGDNWEELALNKATSVLKAAQYTNLIELQCTEDDFLITPKELEMGQKVKVISDGQIYSSILTAMSLKDGIATLTFGTIRLELTKQLKKKWRETNG